MQRRPLLRWSNRPTLLPLPLPLPLSLSRQRRAYSHKRPSLNAATYLSLLRKETQDPIYSLVENISHVRSATTTGGSGGRHRRNSAVTGIWAASPVITPGGGTSNHIPLHFTQRNREEWKPIVSAGDILLALQNWKKIQKSNFPNIEEPFELHYGLPTWVILYLVAYKVRTTTHAESGMLDLVRSCLSSPTTTTTTTTRHITPHDVTYYIPALLILASLHLSHFSLFLPLNTLAHEFFYLPLPAGSDRTNFYWNLFLSALTHIPTASPQKAKLIFETLKRMDGRQMSISSSSYLAVVSDPYVTLEIASYLRDVAQRRGFVPQREHLEAQLRVFSGKGGGTTSDRRSLLRSTLLGMGDQCQAEQNSADWYTEGKPAISPYWLDNRDGKQSTAPDASERIENLKERKKRVGKKAKQALPNVSHSNLTLLLRTFGPFSSFDFLRRLLKEERAKVDLPTISPADAAPVVAIPPKTLKAFDLRGSPARSLSQPTFTSPKKHRTDIYDFTAALQTAARAPSHIVSADKLLELFNSMATISPHPSSSSAFRPTVATYTVLILGLVRRKRYDLASAVFQRVEESGLSMDVICLNVGLQALVRNGQVSRAVYTLARYSGVLRQLGRTPGSTSDRQHSTALLQRPRRGRGRGERLIKPNVVMMNELMAALHHVDRPDVVFRLWDSLEVLFGVLPNETTLCILLQSARTARKLDDSVRGTIAYFALKNPFRSKRRQEEQLKVQNECWKGIVDVVGEEGGEEEKPAMTKPYRNGVWHEMLPLDAAAEIFTRAVCGQAMSQGGEELYNRLVNTVPPAHAVRNERSGHRPYLVLGPLGPFIPPHNVLRPPSSQQQDGRREGRQRQRPGPGQQRSWYPSILLTDLGFRDYILCLGRGASHGLAEIPRVLAWMKVLGVEPSRNTLALSMVLFGEVSMSVVGVSKVGLDGGGNGRRGGSQYEVFVDWLRDWVGSGGMPIQEELAKWVRSIGRDRWGPPDKH